MGRRRFKSRKRKWRDEIELPNSSPPWIELPEDVTANILQRLGPKVMLRSAEKVCRTWQKVCLDPAMWRVIDLKNPDEPEYIGIYNTCCLLVDRSQGQLTDLSIACFGDDDLLKYVADRSNNLRRLTIAHPLRISSLALDEAVKRLPHLEELHLIMLSSVQADNVETIGNSCPMLKSFTLCELYFQYMEDGPIDDDYDPDEYGLAIGKTMPNLRRLWLISNSIKNKGLEAILDGCPHLEFLDLRRCFYLDLQGALGERCSKQIKNLRLPSDSIRDFEWPIPNNYELEDLLDENGALDSDDGDEYYSDTD